MLVARHPLSTALVLSALAATVAVFTFARPEYRDDIPVETVNLAAEEHLSVSAVRDAFAASGIDLRHANTDTEVAWLAPAPPPHDERSLYVNVLPTTGTVGIGQVESDAYEERVGNVVVHYGGGDARTLERVEAAVAALREAGG